MTLHMKLVSVDKEELTMREGYWRAEGDASCKDKSSSNWVGYDRKSI